MQDYYKTNIQNDNDLRKKSLNLWKYLKYHLCV